jgi:acetyl esterase/lipase
MPGGNLSKQHPTFFRRLLPGLMLCLAASVSSAQQPNRPQTPVVNYTPAESGVSWESLRELNFGTPAAMIPYGTDLLQFGLLWLPVPERRPPAQIVFVHGDCWQSSFDVRHTHAMSTALAQAGYAVWALEYRRSGDADGGWPNTFEDIKGGIAHVHPAPDFVDIPVILIGHSSGGHLALLAGAEDPTLKGVIGLAAVTDLVKYSQGNNSCQAATAEFMGGDANSRSTQYQAANPAEKTPHANTVLLHGSADDVVPAEQASLTGARTVMVEGAGHYDWVHPGTEAFNVLLQTLEDMLAAPAS